jgi:hypothetical protein
MLLPLVLAASRLSLLYSRLKRGPGFKRKKQANQVVLDQTILTGGARGGFQLQERS